MAVRVGPGDLFDSLGGGDSGGDGGGDNGGGDGGDGGDCKVFGGEIGQGVFFFSWGLLSCATRDHLPRESGSPEQKSLPTPTDWRTAVDRQTALQHLSKRSKKQAESPNLTNLTNRNVR